MPCIRRRLLISGRVQGVCFRHYTRQAALKKNLTGWVRNLADGRVEAELEGEKEAVDATIAWCRKGPNMAQVDKIEIKEQEPKRDSTDFKIR